MRDSCLIPSTEVLAECLAARGDFAGSPAQLELTFSGAKLLPKEGSLRCGRRAAGLLEARGQDRDVLRSADAESIAKTRQAMPFGEPECSRPPLGILHLLWANYGITMASSNDVTVDSGEHTKRSLNSGLSIAVICTACSLGSVRWSQGERACYTCPSATQRRQLATRIGNCLSFVEAVTEVRKSSSELVADHLWLWIAALCTFTICLLCFRMQCGHRLLLDDYNKTTTMRRRITIMTVVMIITVIAAFHS